MGDKPVLMEMRERFLRANRGLCAGNNIYYDMGLVSYVQNSYAELTQKVTWPTLKELQSSALVVMVAALVIAVVVLAMDQAFDGIMQFIYKLLY